MTNDHPALRLPKISLGLFPTPLQEMTNLSQLLGEDKRLFFKREDLCGVALGGNKIRKLEYLLGEARSRGCDYIVTGGGSQSNQTIATAACAAKAGFQTLLVVPDTTGPIPRRLGELLGARFRYIDTRMVHSTLKEMRLAAKELEGEGHRPFLIAPGAATTAGVLGYVDAMEELYGQLSQQGLHADHVVCCGGTGNTYAGVALGTKQFSPDTKTTVISIGSRFAHKPTLCKMAREAALLRGFSVPLTEDDLNIHFSCGKGMQSETSQGRAAMELCARQEGLFLDPLYTGKAFAGLLELNRSGYFQPGETIVFLHSGGTLTLFNSMGR